MQDRMIAGANNFHQHFGFCYVFHASKCKNEIRLVVTAIRISFRDLQLPRQMRELVLGNREPVPPAELPEINDVLSFDTSDDEMTDEKTMESRLCQASVLHHTSDEKGIDA